MALQAMIARVLAIAVACSLAASGASSFGPRNNGPGSIVVCPAPGATGVPIFPSNTNCSIGPDRLGWSYHYDNSSDMFARNTNLIIVGDGGFGFFGTEALLDPCILTSGNCVYQRFQRTLTNASGYDSYTLDTWQTYNLSHDGVNNEIQQAISTHQPVRCSGSGCFVNNSTSTSYQAFGDMMAYATAGQTLEAKTPPAGVPAWLSGGLVATGIDNLTVNFDAGANFIAAAANAVPEGLALIVTKANNTIFNGNGNSFGYAGGVSVGTFRATTGAQNPTFENATLHDSGDCIMLGGLNGEVTLTDMTVYGCGYSDASNPGGQDHNIYHGMDIVYGVQVINTTGTWSNRSNQLTLASATNVTAHLAIQGANIGAGTVISSITGNVVTLNQNTTGAGSATPVQIFDGDTCLNDSGVTSTDVVATGWTFKSRPGCGVTPRTTACASNSTAGCVYDSTIGCTQTWCSQNGVLDMPCGGNYIIAHDVLEKGPGSQAYGYLIRYGEEVQTTLNPVTVTGGSSTIVFPSGYGMTNVKVGEDIHGTGLAANTVITNVNGTTITISPAAVSNASAILWFSNLNCPAWGDLPTYSVTVDHDIIIDDGPNLQGWGVNNVVCMAYQDANGHCNNNSSSQAASTFTSWTCTITNSIIVSSGAQGSTPLTLGDGCTDGGGNTYYASRTAVGYAAWPYLPRPR